MDSCQWEWRFRRGIYIVCLPVKSCDVAEVIKNADKWLMIDTRTIASISQRQNRRRIFWFCFLPCVNRRPYCQRKTIQPWIACTLANGNLIKYLLSANFLVIWKMFELSKLETKQCIHFLCLPMGSHDSMEFKSPENENDEELRQHNFDTNQQNR